MSKLQIGALSGSQLIVSRFSCVDRKRLRACACFRSLCFHFILFVHFGLLSISNVSEINCNPFSSRSNQLNGLFATHQQTENITTAKMSSPIKRTVGIEDLPPEMICALFEHLPPKDLIACSMVNRRWHSIHATFKLHKLAAIDCDPYDPDYGFKWYNSDQLIQQAERCRPAMFLHLAEKPLLSNLRQLALWDHELEFDHNKLNRFQQLVHLETNTYPAGNVHLNLPRLRVLAIHNFICDLSVDCPKLNTLAYSVGDKYLEVNLDVKHPETIRKLETDLFGAKLTPFKSVECLVAYELEAINKDILLSLPRLRELHYNENIKELLGWEFYGEVGTINRMKRTASEFVNEAKKLRGSDFRFTFCGLQLTNVNVDQIDFGVQLDEEGYEEIYNEYIYMKNYHLIEPGALHFIQRVDYTRLLSYVTGEFPRCFSQKFTGINEVQVADVVKDPDHLLWFLKSLRSLKTLEVHSELSQEFFDQLPAAACSLVSLELGDELCEDELQLNFDFIIRFTRLTELQITQPLSFESLASALKSSAKLVTASFYVQKENRRLWISREKGSTAWKIFERGSWQFESENPDEIVHFVENLCA